MMPEETFRTLVDQLDQLVSMFESHPDQRVQDQVTALLTAVDMLHREGLTRLVERLREHGAEDSLDRASEDPVVETLLGLYGLVDLELPEEPQPATVQPSDAALLRQRARARWVPVASAGEIPDGTMISVDVEDIRALLVNVGGQIFGLRNACSGTDLPMDMGQLRANHLVCAWHGCEYDVRSGQRTDGGEGRLQVYPVAVRGDSVELALQPGPVVQAPAARAGCGGGQCGCS